MTGDSKKERGLYEPKEDNKKKLEKFLIEMSKEKKKEKDGEKDH